MKTKLLLTALFLSATSIFANATSLTINNTKIGKLEKELTKSAKAQNLDLKSIDSLIINGVVNEVDLSCIYTLGMKVNVLNLEGISEFSGKDLPVFGLTEIFLPKCFSSSINDIPIVHCYSNSEMAEIRIASQFTPNLLYINDGNGKEKSILLSWRDEILSYLPKEIDEVFDAPFALYGSKLEEITLNVKSLPKHFSVYWNSKEELPLKKISFPLLKEANHILLKNCLNLQDVYFPIIENLGYISFVNTSVKRLVLPASLKTVSGDQFSSSLKEIVLQTSLPPSLSEPIKSEHLNVTVRIPDGSFSAYNDGGFSATELLEYSETGDQEIKIEKAGTLNEKITADNAHTMVNLKLSGVLYDTDFDVLKICTNLHNLDLRNALVMYSPQTMERIKKEREFNQAFLSAMGKMSMADLNRQYAKGKITSAELLAGQLDMDYINSRAAAGENVYGQSVSVNLLKILDRKLDNLFVPEESYEEWKKQAGFELLNGKR